MIAPPRAALFDVDGTLYCQPPLRSAMAVELASIPVARNVFGAGSLWQTLRAFRQVREELRALGRPDALLEDLQYEQAAARAAVPQPLVRAIVSEWIFTRPLRYVRACRRRGAYETLVALRAAGLRVGVFSDYPTAAKLDALGLGDLVDLQICATDPEVNAFKPHPRGFHRACEQWGLPPGEVLYVGDRPEVDALGALAAGMSCAIVGRRRTAAGTHHPLLSFRDLQTVCALRMPALHAESPQ